MNDMSMYVKCKKCSFVNTILPVESCVLEGESSSLFDFSDAQWNLLKEAFASDIAESENNFKELTEEELHDILLSKKEFDVPSHVSDKEFFVAWDLKFVEFEFAFFKCKECGESIAFLVYA